MIGFGAALTTLSKTVLYWAQEYYCGYCAVGHNNLWDLIFLWIIPNGYIALFSPFSKVVCTSLTLPCRLWIVVPTFIVLQLGKDLAESLNRAAGQSPKPSTDKTKWIHSFLKSYYIRALYADFPHSFCGKAQVFIYLINIVTNYWQERYHIAYRNDKQVNLW